MSLLKGSVLVALLSLPVFMNSSAAQQIGKGDPAQGKLVFREYGCWRCHNTDSPAAKRLRGENDAPAPSMLGIFQRPPHELADGTKHEKHTDEMFRLIITEGTKFMAPRGAILSQKELNDLLAYLHSL